MVIIFRCSADAKQALDQVMARGGYSDYSDVINAAITNYAVLSTALDQKGSIVLPDEQLHPGSSPVPRRIRRTIEQPPSVVVPRSKSAPVLAGIPNLFLDRDLPTEPPGTLAKPPSDVFVPGQPVPVDRWIFGQYSKLLPAKASVRALARLLPDYPNGFPIEKVAPQVAQEAALLGLYLKNIDDQKALGRDEALATGFPSSGENADKSRLRYANQFVASMSKQGQLTGLLADLKLINITSERARRIQLTMTGWALAVLKNPVLDQKEPDTSERLSVGERTLLLDHISRSVPVEDYAYRTILAAISHGLQTPDALSEVVKKLPSSKPDAVSDLFITTQRSGLISRMADLGLVTRQREGVRVSYNLTESGTAYHNRPTAA